MRIPLFAVVLLGLIGIATAEIEAPLYRAAFAEGGWDASAWMLVKSPRWPHKGTWIQEATHIRNATPPDATAEQMLGPRAGETYTSMVLKRRFRDSIVIRATLAFDQRMAPLIILAPALGEDEDGYPEYREHFEVVFWDEGVNVWHHRYDEGKPRWQLAAFSRFPLKPGERHAVEVTYQNQPDHKVLSVQVNGRTFGYRDATLPDVFHVGLTGCEGTNRFYDLAITRP